MTVCPFCKKAVVNPNGGPCPSCGKVPPPAKAASAPAAPSGGDDWDDLEIQRGGSGAVASSSAPSSYSGGGMGGLGDDDDDGPGLSLELDTPVRSMPPQQQQARPSTAPRGTGASGQHPAYGSEQMPQPLPSRSLKPGSDPQMHQQQSSPNMGSQPQMMASQQPQMPPPSLPALAPPGPPDHAAMIARYPPPPRQVWETPIYAMKVLHRQFELRQDIASLKKRRSPDVQLYERALKTHDATRLMIGLAITGAALTIAMFLFFLPVIIRFIRDPD